MTHCQHMNITKRQTMLKRKQNCSSKNLNLIITANLNYIKLLNYWSDYIDIILLLIYVYPNILSMNMFLDYINTCIKHFKVHFVFIEKMNNIIFFNSVLYTIQYGHFWLDWDSLHLWYDCIQDKILSKIIIIMSPCICYNLHIIPGLNFCYIASTV